MSTRQKYLNPLFIVLFFVLILCIYPTSFANQIFWTEGGWDPTKVYSYDLSSENKELLNSSTTYTYIGITVDTTSNKMYLAGKDKIQRGNLDGSGMEQLITGSFTSEGIALDRSSDKMYYSTSAGPWESPYGKILRSNLDGSNPETLLSASITDRINGLALDLINSKMYWTQIDESGAQRSSWICRSNLDGSSIEYLTQGTEILGISLDINNEKMYWTDWIGQKVRRADLDGSNAETIYYSSGNPHSITLDTLNQKAYWTEWNTNAIYRANLDGTGLEQVLSTGANPAGIVYVPEPATLLPLGLGGLFLKRKRRAK